LVALPKVDELLLEAVRDNVASLNLVLNHPSGEPTPSPDDVHLTAEAMK